MNEEEAIDEASYHFTKCREKNLGKKQANTYEQFKNSSRSMIEALTKNENPFELNREFLEKLAVQENFDYRFYKTKPIHSKSLPFIFSLLLSYDFLKLIVLKN
jgi:hypothetical protein